MTRVTRAQTPPFKPHTFLSEVGRGKTSLPAPNKSTIFSQGDAADAVFYIQAGKVKLTVVSQQGKEAVVAILEEGAFFGESCLAGHTVRTATATTVENSSLLRIDKEAMIQVLRDKPEFAQLFMAYLLTHTMIGTTRSCVSFFMNKFRKLGFIDYNGEMHVHSSLLNVVLHD